MRSSLASRLKASSPLQLALVALGSVVLAGAGTAAVTSLPKGADASERAFTGGDQDFVRGTTTEGNAEPDGDRTQQTNDAQGQSRDDGRPTVAEPPRSERTDPTAGNGGAPVPARGGGPSGAGGPQGDTGGAGPKGDAGGAGPKGDTGGAGPKPAPGSGGAAGPTGPSGNAGSGGPTTGPGSSGDTTAPKPPRAPVTAPAPAVLVVKDANGATAGTLVSADPNAEWLTFSFKDRSFIANARTGALDLPKIDTSYATDDCTGTVYAPLSRSADSVLRSANPAETGIYEFGQPGSVEVRSIWQSAEDGPGVCLQYVYTNSELAPLRELSAGDRPPTLTGPLKAVRG